MSQNEQPIHQFIKLPEVMKICAMSRSTIYKAIDLGEFPKPIKIGDRGIVWTLASIYEWQESCINASKS